MALRAARNAGLYVPNETIDRSIDYVKRSQNADGGFMYMLSNAGESDFPRSAAAVVALYSAGIYKGPEIAKGLDYLRHFMPAEGVTRREMLLFLRPLLRRAGHMAGGRRAIRPLVHGRRQRVDLPPTRRRLVAGGPRGKHVRHRDGLHRSGDSKQLFADFSAVGEVESGEWRGERHEPAIRGTCFAFCIFQFAFCISSSVHAETARCRSGRRRAVRGETRRGRRPVASSLSPPVNSSECFRPPIWFAGDAAPSRAGQGGWCWPTAAC